MAESDSSSKNEKNSDKSESQSRSESGYISKSISEKTMSEQPMQRKIFSMDVYLDEDQINTINKLKLNTIFLQIMQASGCNSIKIDDTFHIPQLNGELIKIEDDSIMTKSKACEQLLKELHQGYLENSLNYKKDACEFTIMILIPEGLVSLLIGRKGTQINKIMADSNTNIIANQPIKEMTSRTISIKGKYQSIAKACYYALNIITDLIEQRSTIAYEIEKAPPQTNIKNTMVKGKFIFSKRLTDFLMIKSKQIIRNLEEKLSTSIKFIQDRHLDFMSKDEYICVIKGKLEPVQSTIVYLLRQINEYYIAERNKPEYLLRLLIPNNYVTKLIGKSGCMIRDIAKRSGGAQIKILSDKQTEKEYSECMIQIAGTLANKQDASCLVIEKIEQFRNGGPVLLTGKNLNDDIVAQYKNSIYNNSKFEEELSIGIKGRKSCKQHRKNSSASIQSSKSVSRSRSRSRQKKHKSPKKERDSSREKNNLSQYVENVLKIPILIPQYLASKLKENDSKLIKIIKKETGSQLQIEKDTSTDSSKLRKVVLNGTIKQNTKAFELLQKLFIDLQ